MNTFENKTIIEILEQFGVDPQKFFWNLQNIVRPCIRAKGPHGLEFLESGLTLDNLFIGAFDWCETPEGTGYWQQKHNTFSTQLDELIKNGLYRRLPRIKNIRVSKIIDSKELPNNFMNDCTEFKAEGI